MTLLLECLFFYFAIMHKMGLANSILACFGKKGLTRLGNGGISSCQHQVDLTFLSNSSDR